MRLLLAEDEKALSEALVEILKRNHYSVDPVYDGQDALDYGLSENYDGIILDIMMPKKNGLEVLQSLREQGVSTPVLMLTAKSTVTDKIAGLNLGADDYLPKPFVMGEFNARVRALVRRGTEFTPSMMSCGNITLNRSNFQLSCGTASIRLGNKEFQMMEMLIRQKGRFISTEQFMERIWGFDSEAEINVVWAYISFLRRKLSSLDADIRITASRNRGYTLEAVA